MLPSKAPSHPRGGCCGTINSPKAYKVMFPNPNNASDWETLYGQPLLDVPSSSLHKRHRYANSGCKPSFQPRLVKIRINDAEVSSSTPSLITSHRPSSFSSCRGPNDSHFFPSRSSDHIRSMIWKTSVTPWITDSSTSCPPSFCWILSGCHRTLSTFKIFES